MSENPVHKTHAGHEHVHGPGCGHASVNHEGHVDYLHDGHLHHAHAGHTDECQIEASAANPDQCTPEHRCQGHGQEHQHGPRCGHEAVPHAGHTDYLVAGHLHHPHRGHCDDHGSVG